MTQQEKQVILHNLEVVTPIFQEFEAAYNIVTSLSRQKKIVVDIDKMPNVKRPFPTSFGELVGPAVRSTNIGRRLNQIFQFDPFGAGQDEMMEKIKQHNEEAVINNAEIDQQVAIAQQKCDEVRRRYALIDMSWYPPDYQFSDASSFFYKALRNGMCETLGQAVVLYEDRLFKNQVLANQQQQINLAFQQCILQGQTIAAIQYEGNATRQTIQSESEAIRGTIQAEGEATRGAIHAEGQESRKQCERQFKDFRNLFGR